MTLYVNQYFTVLNLALASKYVFDGISRIATKVEPDEPVGYDAQESANVAEGTMPGATKEEPLTIGESTSSATEESGLVDKALDFLGWKREGGHPGQGLEHRSDRANEVAQNTLKNPNLTGQKPGQGRLSGKPGNNAGGNSGKDKTNNGGANTDNSNNGNGGGNTVEGINGGGNKAPYDYGGTFLYFYHPDHLGSTAHVTDGDGELYEHIQYFPFGEGWVQEAANTIQRVPYRYTSKELDEETGLYYYGARYYDPRTSVWQSADPIIDLYLGSNPGKLINGGIFRTSLLNLYSYTSQKPVMFIDPDGRSEEDVENVAKAIDRKSNEDWNKSFLNGGAKVEERGFTIVKKDGAIKTKNDVTGDDGSVVLDFL